MPSLKNIFMIRKLNLIRGSNLFQIMVDKNRPTRLAKAAKEFNVGMHTIVEFLHKKGYADVEENPNYKLTPEMVSIVAGEYQSEKSLKDEAAKIEIDYKKLQNSAEKKVAEDSTETDIDSDDSDKDSDDLMIKGTSVPPARNSQKEKEEKPAPKVEPIGNDLSPEKKQNEKTVKKEEVKEEKTDSKPEQPAAEKITATEDAIPEKTEKKETAPQQKDSDVKTADPSGAKEAEKTAVEKPEKETPKTVSEEKKPTSAWKLAASNATTVRHTPLTAMLSPSCTASNGSEPVAKVKRRSPPRGWRACSRPRPSMIPVNIRTF